MNALGFTDGLSPTLVVPIDFTIEFLGIWILDLLCFLGAFSADFGLSMWISDMLMNVCLHAYAFCH